MRLRLFSQIWQQLLWKFVTHPVTEIAALLAVVLVSLWTLVVTETRASRGSQPQVVFGPR